MSNGGRAGVCVVGAAGRMGARVVRRLSTHPRLQLVSALEQLGKGVDLGGAQARVTPDPAQALAGAQVVIDFAAPPLVQTLAPLCAAQHVPYLVASTGLSALDEAAIDAAAAQTAVLQAANLSLGVNVMLELVELASRWLAGFDVEIFEIHHRHKRDAPSGTALALGKAVERGRGSLKSVHARSGQTGERAADELGFAALRGGEVAGEHTVYYFGEAERLEITHRAADADVFAEGALVAAEYLLSRPPGRYTMRDVLAAARPSG